ncbi:MAG: ion transporter [Nanoarchaeota archaeon]|nr:ion transporter [Nanoarchaeota archaeon]
MKKWLHRIEVIIDKSIPYLVVLLLFLILGEFFYKELLEDYHLYVIIADYFIIGVFVVDLCFKFYRVRNFKIFLKKYWLDIIAVFPFFLLFRVFEEVYALFRLGGEISEGQMVLHTGVEIEKIAKEERIIRELRELEKGGKVFTELEKGTKLSRMRFITRMFRPIQRIPRFAKAFSFYEKPIKKDYKILKKDVKKVEKILEKDFKKIKKRL